LEGEMCVNRILLATKPKPNAGLLLNQKFRTFNEDRQIF